MRVIVQKLQQTPRVDKRIIFAIILIFFGIILPFFSALTSPLPLLVLQTKPANDQIVVLPGFTEVPAGLLPMPTRNPAVPPPSLSQATVLPNDDVFAPPSNGELLSPTEIPVELPVAGEEPAPQDPVAQEPAPLSGVALSGTFQPVPTPFGNQQAGSSVSQAPAEVISEVAGPPPPILMYHYIRDVDPTTDSIGYGLSVSPYLFEQHLAWLANQGYTTVGMQTATRCIMGEINCPERGVALTFDDGYADAYEYALPLLQEYGFVATFYIITDRVGQPGYMTWEQITALKNAGMEIGSHTVSHPDLTDMDIGTLVDQLETSKALLEEQLGVSVTSFCYPSGRYDATVLNYVQTAGYTNAVTTRWDYDTSNQFAFPRRRIGGGTDASSFAAIVQN
jgi:peptidoglycan/xylan/chitin deacetylase (PgdA/CDA1 family)